MVLVLSMSDLAARDGILFNIKELEQAFKVPVIELNGRNSDRLHVLKNALENIIVNAVAPTVEEKMFYKPSDIELQTIQRVSNAMCVKNDYHALLLAHHHQWLQHLNQEEHFALNQITKDTGFEDLKLQIRETMQRYNRFTPVVQRVLQSGKVNHEWTEWADRILTHRFWGVIIFFTLLGMVFQAIYAWATLPMDWIEGSFGYLSSTLKANLPAGWFTSLLTEGVIAGLGGVLVFIPQIAILFLLISLLEEVGYMSRAVFLFDQLMQRFGLNGRSIVALVSGGACAIPAIMSTRTISNWKERLITIMVTPLISCSARIPVYTVLIGFVVPPVTVLGILNIQGLAFMGLYLLGIGSALLSALVFKLILRIDEQSFLMLELPEYKMPSMKNIFLTVWEKIYSFITEAGKIILLISIALWFLASFGLPRQMELAKQEAITLAAAKSLDEEATNQLVAAKQMEASFAGQVGKAIEPLIKPLGFDWKIGIALITSFAAREVFVGTMATIYSIGSDADEYTIRDKLAKERDPVTGKPVYGLATSLSLLIFYVFAMQCMSTLAVVKKETNSWRWPIIQFTYMTAMAYLGSLLTYQLLA